jgi:hypothetical protein
VVEARDAVYVALNLPHDNDTADQWLTALDAVFVGAMGALDVTARVAHRTLGLDPRKITTAAWQRKAWRNSVRAADGRLGCLVSGGSNHERALAILGPLRNTVHAAALDALAVLDRSGRRAATLLEIPVENTATILEAMDALDGRAQWGVRNELVAGRAHADPAVLMDRMLAAVLALLNDILHATPVHQLAGATVDQHGPPQPPDARLFVFSEAGADSIRWQLGL